MSKVSKEKSRDKDRSGELSEGTASDRKKKSKVMKTQANNFNDEAYGGAGKDINAGA